MPTKPDARTGRRHADHGTVNAKHMISFGASDELRNRMNRMADKHGKTRAVIIRDAIEHWLERYGY